ncbi:hypothetical protein LTR08_007657 [Meristemomyces frigidus]|nr:hypothetical protein LTR08_007657 [Meristemomyces frigidus]
MGKGKNRGGQNGGNNNHNNNNNNNNNHHNNNNNNNYNNNNNNNNNRPLCNWCKKPGHLEAKCWTKERAMADRMNIDNANGTSSQHTSSNGNTSTGKYCTFHKNQSHSDAECKAQKNPQSSSQQGVAPGGDTFMHNSGNLFANYNVVHPRAQLVETIAQFALVAVSANGQLANLQQEVMNQQQVMLALMNYNITEADVRASNERLQRAQYLDLNGGFISPPVQAPYANAACVHFPSTAKDFVAAAEINSRDWSRYAHLPAAEQKFILQKFYEEAINQQTEQERKIHAHCERSLRMYKKENYQSWILAHEGLILQSNVLASDQNYVTLKSKMASSLQLWRDPQALGAISHDLKPNCNTCHRDGAFLDARFRPVPVHADVLNIEDFNDWGVFVGFDCRCCNQDASFSYVSRPACEL